MSKVDPNANVFTGKKSPVSLQKGPATKHLCTDMICLIVFALVCTGLAFVAFYSFSNGDPAAVSAPYDQYGQPCGLGAQADTPYLYFIEQVGIFAKDNTVCLKECPVGTKSNIDCALDYVSAGHKCSDIQAYPSTSFANRLCLPTDPGYLQSLDNIKALDLSFLFKGSADLYVTWWMMLVVGGIGILVGLIYILMMRFCSVVVTWGLLVLYELALLGFGGLCILESLHSSLVQGLSISSLSSVNPLTLQIIGGAFFLIALISLILMCMFKRKLKLAVAVLQEASEFISDNITIIFVPPLLFLFSLAFYTFWIFTFVYIVGCSDISPTQKSGPFDQVDLNRNVVLLLIFHFLALIWIHLFLSALPEFVIASSASIWYFRKVKTHRAPIALSIFRAILHTGSIALGAFMIGIVDYIRMVFKIFEKPLMASKRDKNHWCAKYCTSCFRGCLACFEGCLKFIDRHAYVQMAVNGKGFCHSTREAFYLILRNSIKFGTVHGMGTFFVFFGQIFITFATTSAGYIILVVSPYFQQQLFSPIVPTIFFALISLTIGRTYMDIYGVAADAIIHCYAIDDEIHDGGAKYAPTHLRRLVDRSSRKPLLASVSKSSESLDAEAIN